MGAWHILRGAGGHFELGRVLGAVGGFNYVIWPPIFQAWAIAVGQAWDPAAFCAAYGGGLALAAAGIGAMIAIKDTAVGKAKAVGSEG